MKFFRKVEHVKRASGTTKIMILSFQPIFTKNQCTTIFLDKLDPFSFPNWTENASGKRPRTVLEASRAV